ncbi:MAG: hypothetical protein WC848_06115 [Parcubacteria group bacterium]|jgi:hypothetical protein
MNKKQVVVLSLALVVLFGSIYFVARKISDGNRSINPKNMTNDKKEIPVNIFSQDANNQQSSANDVSGNIEKIAEKTLTIKNSRESVSVNINGATPVMISVNGNNTVLGQIADIKKDDVVRVTYDVATKNVKMILVIRP